MPDKRALRAPDLDRHTEPGRDDVQCLAGHRRVSGYAADEHKRIYTIEQHGDRGYDVHRYDRRRRHNLLLYRDRGRRVERKRPLSRRPRYDTCR